MNKNAKIFVAGHQGMVGSAILRLLRNQNYSNLITIPKTELNLSNTEQVQEFFEYNKPDYVFLAAAKVGGIFANQTYPADFIYQNLLIQTNVIHAAHLSRVNKLLFLGSSCIYPRDCAQPIKEEYLLGGRLEASNQPYAIAKIAGVQMCQAYRRQYGSNFICLMPTNLYGPGDNFNLKTSHVLPALIRKFHEALPNKPVTLWGTGAAFRELLHVDDLASACLFLMNHYNAENPINVGTGEDLQIKELATLVQEIIGHQGKIVWDKTKPDGTPRKCLDVSHLEALGWKYKIPLNKGIKMTYSDFKRNYEAIKK